MATPIGTLTSTVRRRPLAALCVAIALTGGCAGMTDLEPILANPSQAPSAEVMNVARCLMGKLQPDGTYRRWKIVLTLPDDPTTEDRRKRDFIYRGTPPGETVATHIADCTIPNSPAAVDMAFRAIAGLVVPRMPISK